jgi:hypothetical protein
MAYNYFAPFGRRTNVEYTKAVAPVAAAAMQQPALFAKNFADNYASYAGGLANNTTAQANFYGNLASQSALAQAANSGMISNLGSAAMTGYGQAAQGAFDAWKGNQQAYNSSLASMHDANQRGVTGAGALGALSQFSGNFGGDGGGGGGGFSAEGPNGSIASGSYGGSPLSGLGGVSFSGGSSGGGAGQAMDNAMALAQSGADRLDKQHYSSRMMPSQMLDQSLAGFTSLGNQAYDQGQRGMNQFYGFLNQTAERPDFKSPLAMLNTGYGTANSQVNDLFNRSLGNTQFFKSPLQNQLDQHAAEDAVAARQAASAAAQKRKMDAFLSSWADEVNSGQRSPGTYGRR